MAKVEADVLVDGLTDRLADNCIHSAQLKTQGTNRHTGCQATRSLVPDTWQNTGRDEAQWLLKQLADKLAEV